MASIAAASCNLSRWYRAKFVREHAAIGIQFRDIIFTKRKHHLELRELLQGIGNFPQEYRPVWPAVLIKGKQLLKLIEHQHDWFVVVGHICVDRLNEFHDRHL
jgi:hypothetical protein